MNLVEILARELKEWPIRAEEIGQWPCGEVCVRDLIGVSTREIFTSITIADDIDAWVTRAQWEAERARILAESSKFTEADKAHIAELTAIACGKRSKEDQALWDKVAIAAISGLTSWKDGPESLAEDAFDIADAFIAERAKRMKG